MGGDYLPDRLALEPRTRTWGKKRRNKRAAGLRNVPAMLRHEPDALPERCRGIQHAIDDDVSHRADVVNVVEGIRVEQDEVGALVDFDGADFRVQTHHLR